MAPWATAQYRQSLAPRYGDDNHPALGLGQSRFAKHQRIVIGEERAKLVGTMRERQEYIGNESGLFLYLQHSRANNLG